MWLKKCKSYSLKNEEKRFTASLQSQKVLTKSYSVLNLPNQTYLENAKTFSVQDLPLQIKKYKSVISFDSQGQWNFNFSFV